MQIFDCIGVGVPNPHAVQGSAVLDTFAWTVHRRNLNHNMSETEVLFTSTSTYSMQLIVTNWAHLHHTCPLAL